MLFLGSVGVSTAPWEPLPLSRDLLLASKPSALCHTHDTHDSAAVKSAFLAEGHFIVTCPPIESGRAQQGPENVSITLLA